MSKFAVGFHNLFDNELTIEILEGAHWREATIKHSKTLWSVLEEYPNDDGAVAAVPLTVQDAKREAFDSDSSFDVQEIS